ncbi:MAG: SDR family oxidoreductase [Bacteroidales bacterium]|nr:SDR family oxidoreductase [Bacteroidales bacterium]
MYNPFSLEGKKILVTGASSGIGAETAVECSRLGANVIITGRNERRLKETFSRMEKLPSLNHKMLLADLTNESDLEFLVDQIDGLDGLVNNAGVNRVKPLVFIKQEDFDYIFQNNTFAGIHLIRLLSKGKKFNKNSSIVFTSSVSALFNAPGRALYASSKAALTSLMRSVAVELADKNIRANAVLPGMVETKLICEYLSDEDREKDMKEYPLKRYGRPEEIAWAIIYLLSDASAWVTGASLIIDGGFMLK